MTLHANDSLQGKTFSQVAVILYLRQNGFSECEFEVLGKKETPCAATQGVKGEKQ